MGTAFSFPCSDNNHSISIIGTHLENDFIDLINLNKHHPVLDIEIPKNVKITVEKSVVIKIFGIDKDLVGKVASEIKMLKPVA